MPDAPRTGTIHPEALKAARERQQMTQEQLAKAAGCTKDTVSRWERGTSKRVRSHLRKPLCNALGVKWEKLTTSPERISDQPRDIFGQTLIKMLVSKRARAALQLVALRYNIKPRDVVELAPLLFLIIAERSLMDRKQRLDELDVLIEEASRSLPKHMFGIVAPRNVYGEDPSHEEKLSIEAKDIFGLKLPDPSDENEERRQEANPFINFILDLTRELPKDAVDFIETYDGDEIDDYQIAGDTLRERTGITDDEERGEELLSVIRRGEIDLAECLRVRRDRDDLGYREWLSAELARVEKEWPLWFLNDDLEPFDAQPSPSGQSAPHEGGSEQ